MTSESAGETYAGVNGIKINYKLDVSSSHAQGQLLVLINGLADDLQTWDAQVPAFLSAGYRVLRYDNRGIGRTSKPRGLYTAELLADDLHGLLKAVAVMQLHVTQFHLLGVSMGGMIGQSYALRYANGSAAAEGLEMLSLSLCCTYAQPTTFCLRMFALWADMAQKMSIQDVMRDVILWCFTVPFFRTRTDELGEIDQAMADLDMPLHAYLSQLNVIQKFDSTSALESLRAHEQGLGGLANSSILILAGKVDVLIPVVLSRELAELIEGSHFITTRGGHACSLEFPDDFNKSVLTFLSGIKTRTDGH